MMSSSSFLKSLLPLFIQTAKAHRKPRWLPVAKSKIYRIPKRPIISEEEKLELQRIHNNYKTQMRAIRRFFHEDMIKEKSTLQSASSEMSQQRDAAEWERCIAINGKWNLQVAAEREERRKQELAALEAHALSRMEARDIAHAERLAKASAEIIQLKELSKTFITLETLDAAIEHALANPVDFNFAIDLKETQYLGRVSPITLPKDDKKKTTST